jgi:hypothetical protein
MAELDRELFALGAQVALPAERDLWPGINARLAESGAPPRPRLRIAAVVVAVLAVALGVAFAVPPARSAILRFFGLEGVSIVRVEKLPPVTHDVAVLGQPTTLAAAGEKLGFRPLLPDLGEPGGVYLDPTSQAVLILYGKPVRLRLEETRLGVFGKILTIRERTDRVTVNGNRGVWLTGAHVFNDFFSQPRLSGNALLWEHEGITLRLEGRFSKAEALRIARSVRPR